MAEKNLIEDVIEFEKKDGQDCNTAVAGNPPRPLVYSDTKSAGK